MNIFRVIASGKQKLREEFVSAFLAYLFSPSMDHGLGATLFTNVIKEIASSAKNDELLALSNDFKETLRSDLFEDERQQLDIELEFPISTSKGNKRFIDILARYKDWFFIIENKINHGSFTKNQTKRQYQGIRKILVDKGIADPRIVLIYLVPAIPIETGWATSQKYSEELSFNYDGNDFGAVVYWQPTQDEKAISMVDIIRNILKDESKGAISPLSYDIKQNLKSFIDFSLGEFKGYHYETPFKKVNTNKVLVSDVLVRDEDIYIGIQYGQGGLISKAWRNINFLKDWVSMSDEPLGWQYLELSVFKKFTQWAIDPENNDLAGIKWTGKPFGTVNLYHVAKTAGDDIHIGIKGGIKALKRMTAEDITNREYWELHPTKKNSSWFSGVEFCEIIENLPVQEVLDAY